MASGSQLIKVAVLHKVESVSSAVKVWRFDPGLISSYKLEEVEKKFLNFFLTSLPVVMLEFVCHTMIHS